MSIVSDIIHQADKLRSAAASLLANVEKLDEAPAGRITSVAIGGESISLSFWNLARGVDIRAFLVEVYTAAADRCVAEADALEARVQVVEP